MPTARRLKPLVLYAVGSPQHTLSYQQGWPTAFARDPRFEATLVNVITRSGRIALRAALTTRAFDSIVVLHSVLSNQGVLNDEQVDELAAHPAPKAYFVGNEYKLMPQKMEFCERLGVSLLVTMMHSPRVHALYRERLGGGVEIVMIPSGGVDTSVFFPTSDLVDRPIDLGMRAFADPLHIGHQERLAIARYFVDNAERLGLTVDVSFDRRDRFAPEGYAAFLNRCRGQLGTEAGGDHFELTDQLFRRMHAYELEHPSVTIEELQSRFLADHEDPVSARSITGRHAEAAATMTVQILFAGEYSGYFEPDVHYLSLAKDFANVDDVLSRFRDDAHCREIAENAYRVAVEELTYERLLDRFVAALRPFLPPRPLRPRLRLPR